MKSTVYAVDLFYGAGGTSSGLYRACHAISKSVDLLAVNHWQTAIETHKLNHPKSRHICARVESLRPENLFPADTLEKAFSENDET